jgi:hypothetical protein
MLEDKMIYNFNVSDGFCGEVSIIVEIAADKVGSGGGNHDPHVSLTMRFEQQHKISVKRSHNENGMIEIDMPTMKFEAWGCEGREIGNVFIKAGEAINRGLTALNCKVGGYAKEV